MDDVHAKSDLRGMVLGAPNSMMTNVPGLYAFGEVNYQYHGATRLGANALLSCIFDGLFCGDGVAAYVRDQCDDSCSRWKLAPFYESIEAQEHAKVDALIEGTGEENPYQIGVELGQEMTAAGTVVKIRIASATGSGNAPGAQGAPALRPSLRYGHVDEPEPLVHAGTARHAAPR